MGLLHDLDYEPSESNALQRGLQQVAASKPGAWLFSKFIHAVDKPLFAATDGRHTLPSLLTGLPVVMLTTTGRTSGAARSTPLVGIPVGDDLAVIGSNFGQEHTPGWVYNLEAQPDATVEYRGSAVDVGARPADDEETASVFETAATIYPGYSKYRERADHRTIKVFVLETADAS